MTLLCLVASQLLREKQIFILLWFTRRKSSSRLPFVWVLFWALLGVRLVKDAKIPDIQTHWVLLHPSAPYLFGRWTQSLYFIITVPQLLKAHPTSEIVMSIKATQRRWMRLFSLIGSLKCVCLPLDFLCFSTLRPLKSLCKRARFQTVIALCHLEELLSKKKKKSC